MNLQVFDRKRKMIPKVDLTPNFLITCKSNEYRDMRTGVRLQQSINFRSKRKKKKAINGSVASNAKTIPMLPGLTLQIARMESMQLRRQ